jgi:hypothetical protein
VAQIREQFPTLYPWLDWWLQPDHARLIFESQKIMPESVRVTLPKTTNPQESMHNTLYLIAGKDHTVIGGLKGLLRASEYFQARYSVASSEHMNLKSENHVLNFFI